MQLSILARSRAARTGLRRGRDEPQGASGASAPRVPHACASSSRSVVAEEIERAGVQLVDRQAGADVIERGNSTFKTT
jgi:hypothetical protein